MDDSDKVVREEDAVMGLDNAPAADDGLKWITLIDSSKKEHKVGAVLATKYSAYLKTLSEDKGWDGVLELLDYTTSAVLYCVGFIVRDGFYTGLPNNATDEDIGALCRLVVMLGMHRADGKHLENLLYDDIAKRLLQPASLTVLKERLENGTVLSVAAVEKAPKPKPASANLGGAAAAMDDSDDDEKEAPAENTNDHKHEPEAVPEPDQLKSFTMRGMVLVRKVYDLADRAAANPDTAAWAKKRNEETEAIDKSKVPKGDQKKKKKPRSPVYSPDILSEDDDD